MKGKIYKNRLTTATSNEQLPHDSSIVYSRPMSPHPPLNRPSQFSPQQNHPSVNEGISSHFFYPKSPSKNFANDILFETTHVKGSGQKASII